MLVLWRLFGLLVRERSVLKLVGANLKDGQNVLVGGSVPGIVEGGVGGTGARAADGCWLRRVFLSSVMALACLRACAADRVPPDWGSPRTWRGRWVLALLGGFHLIGCNTSSVISNMMDPVLLAPFCVVFVLPVTCYLPCGTIGARSNAKLAPGTCCFVLRERVL